MIDPRMRALLRPRSVAVYGVVQDPTALAAQPMANLRAYGGNVDVFSVGSTTVRDATCVPDLKALAHAGPVDVLLAPSVNERFDVFLREAASAARVIVVTQVADDWAHPRRRRTLERIVGNMGALLMGPNALGVANLVERRVALASYNLPRDLAAGGVAFVSQSGAVATTALLRADASGARFNILLASGSELGLTVGEVVAAVAHEPSTRAIALYFEGLKDPRTLIEAGDTALRNGVPVVVLRGGRTTPGMRAAATHSGALATDDRRLRTALRDHGFVEVDDIDSLWATASVLAERPRPSGPRVGMLTPSGGLSVLLADGAQRYELTTPSISQETRGELHRLLPGTQPANPYETTARILVRPRLLREVLRTFYGDTNVDLGLFATNIMMGERGVAVAEELVDLPERVRPAVMMMPGAGPYTADAFDVFRAAGVVVVSGLETALSAMRALARFAEYRAPSPGRIPLALRRAAAELRSGDGAVPILASLGIEVPRERWVSSPTAAQEAAIDLGPPVVLKAVAEGLVHKSDAGGVILDVTSGRQAAEGYRSLQERFGDRLRTVVVQEHVHGVAELLVGAFHDVDLGPMVAVGLGGIWAEVLDDVILSTAPVNKIAAAQLLRSLQGAPTLAGGRGSPEGDVPAAAAAIAAMSRLAAASPQGSGTLEVNPLMVLPRGQGVRAVDVRFEPGAGMPSG